eukprot:m.432780 g.432780  ORF g.432780 m.432780 type:complete len:288 (-) comp21414_c1_seq4:782-1645(-)
MSSSDLDVDRDIFNGRIAVAFTIASNEIPHGRSSDTYEPFFMLAPRTGYLTLCAEKIRQHFHLPVPSGSNSSENVDEMWFEHEGRALKWNMPIGVLYDCIGSDRGLPWSVTVHIKNYPETILLRCPSMATIETYFVNQLKQACHIKHGTTQVDGLQSEQDRKELWFGLTTDDFEHYRRVNEKLMLCSDGHWFKRAPFRIYVVDAEVAKNANKQIVVLQQPFDLTTADGVPLTLANLLDTLLGQLQPSKVVTHGIEPPRDTPLQWLCEHCTYPDNFLHLTVFVSAAVE